MLFTGASKKERANTPGKLKALRAMITDKGMDWLHTAKQDRNTGSQPATNRRKDFVWDRWGEFMENIGLKDLLMRELSSLQQ